jgi:hypothetical protein
VGEDRHQSRELGRYRKSAIITGLSLLHQLGRSMGRSFWAAIAGATASALTFAAIQEGIGLSIGWLPLQTLLFGLVIAVIVAAILGGSFAALVDSDFKEPVYWFVFAGLLVVWMLLWVFITMPAVPTLTANVGGTIISFAVVVVVFRSLDSR